MKKEKISGIFLTFGFVFMLIMFSHGYIKADDDNETEVVEVEEIIPAPEENVDSIEIFYPEYQNWEVATLEGKLKMKGLPLSPSLKIFMLKDSIICASVRAPFVGEAGRLEITPDSITVINKMNKTYLSEKLGRDARKGGFFQGIGLSEIQDLLLARFFIPGKQLDEIDIEDYIDVIIEGEQINVVPNENAEIEGFKYGYIVDYMFNPLALIVMPQANPDMEVAALYTYGLKGYDIRLLIQDNNKLIEATLELKEPAWKGDMPNGIDVNKKFRKVSLEEFMRM